MTIAHDRVFWFRICWNKPVIVKFDQEHAHSDSGATLLQACDRRLGLTDAWVRGN